MTPRSAGRVDPVRATMGLEDLDLHDLRHSGNTWAAATGASTAELMGRLGHASPVAALRYQHATADRDRAIADALSGSEPRPVLRWSTSTGESRRRRTWAPPAVAIRRRSSRPSSERPKPEVGG